MIRFILVFILLIAALIAWPLRHQRGGTHEAYQTAAVQRGDLITTTTASGTVSALMLVDVGSQISGQVKELYADFNSPVRQGQVIARISPESYEAKVAQTEAELDIAQAMVASARAEIERSRAELESAMAGLDVAKAETARARLGLNEAAKELERKRPLASKSVITAKEWSDTQYSHRVAQTELDTVRVRELRQEWQVHAAEATLRGAEAQLENTLAQVKQRAAALRQATTELEYTYIRAPITGVVVSRNVSPGQTVAASLSAPTLFAIAGDLTRMQVEASIVEADIGRVAVGQSATFTVDAYPGRTFSGDVTQIRKAPQTVQNVVTYVVVISTDNSDQALLPGMTANLRITIGRRENVLLVANKALRFRYVDTSFDSSDLGPQSAWAEGLQNEENGAGTPGRVFILGAAGEPISMPVRVGTTDGVFTEVLAGEVREGQSVIIGRKAPAPETDRMVEIFGIKLL